MYDTKHPVILPDDHRVTERIVLERQKFFHNSFAEALSQVRSQVWLIRDRQVAKKVLLYPSPVMSNFWEFRVNEERPFKYIGIDFCGPVIIKSEKSMNKNYIALRTCPSSWSRQVYLELVPDLALTTLIRSLHCFMWRRGILQKPLKQRSWTFSHDIRKHNESSTCLVHPGVIDYWNADSIGKKVLTKMCT